MEVHYWQFYVGIKGEMGEKLQKNCREIGIVGSDHMFGRVQRGGEKYNIFKLDLTC